MDRVMHFVDGTVHFARKLIEPSQDLSLLLMDRQYLLTEGAESGDLHLLSQVTLVVLLGHDTVFRLLSFWLINRTGNEQAATKASPRFSMSKG
jgi:hypothetical protein